MQTNITVEDICRRLKPIIGKRSDQLYLKYALSEDKDDKDQLQRLLNILYEKHLNTTLLSDNILLEPPKKDELKGKYPLGQITYSGKDFSTFCLREEDWQRHVCISGMSSSGKTNFAFEILANFIYHKKPFIVFDWKKSFRPITLIDKSILCFSIGNFKIKNSFSANIIKPPKNVDPKDWISILSDIIIESFNASYGAQKMLKETLDSQFKKRGVYKGSKDFPTFRDIKKDLENSKEDILQRRGRGFEWYESFLRIIDSLTFGSFGDSINSKEEDFSVNDLLEKQSIFELHPLSSTEKKFFCEYLLSYIFFEKKFDEQPRKHDLNTAFIIDEAHHIFLKDKTSFVKESVPEMIYREIREYGISMICLDQHISKLSEAVSGNSATNIAFQQIFPKDIDTVSGIMQLKDKKHYFSMLQVGQCIVKLSERYFKPFLINVPLIKKKDNFVSDKKIKDNMKRLIKNSRQKKIFLKSCSIHNITKKVSKDKYKNQDLDKYEDEKENIGNITKDHLIFLERLDKGPCMTTKLYQNLEGYSLRQCNKIKNDLLNGSLITSTIKKTKSCRQKVLNLTKKGKDVVKGFR